MRAGLSMSEIEMSDKSAFNNMADCENNHLTLWGFSLEATPWKI